MPLDLRSAASNMIDAGASDEDIKTVLGAIKQQAASFVDQGLSDEEIQRRLSASTWGPQKIPIFNAAPTPPTTGRSLVEQNKGNLEIPQVPKDIVDRAWNVALTPVEAAKWVWDTGKKSLELPSVGPFEERPTGVMSRAKLAASRFGDIGAVIPRAVSYGALKNWDDVGALIMNMRGPGAVQPKTPYTNKEVVAYTPDQAARHRLGEVAFGSLTGAPLYKGIKALVGPALAPSVTGAVGSAVEPLSRGDLADAAERGAGGALTAKIAQTAAAVPRNIREGRQVNKAGGADEILSAATRKLAAPRTPGPLGGSDAPPTISEAGSTAQRAYDIARNSVKNRVNQLNEIAEKATPKNVVKQVDSVFMMANVADDVPPSLRTAMEKKLAATGKAMLPSEGKAKPSSFRDFVTSDGEKLQINAAGQSPETQAQIKKALGLTVEEAPTGEFNLSQLYALRRRVNAITPKPGTPDSFVLGQIKKAIDADVEKFRPDIPEAVQAWKASDRFYESEYAPYFKQGGSIRSAMGEPEGRRFDSLEQIPGAGRVRQFDQPGSPVIDNLLKLPIEDLRKWRYAMMRPSGETLPGGAVPRSQSGVFENIRSAVTQKMIDYSINPETGKFSPADFANRVRGGGPDRAAKYRLLMGDKGYDDLTKFVSELEKAGLGSYIGNQQYALKKGSYESPAAVEFGELYHATTGAAQIMRGSPMGWFHVGQAGMLALVRPVFNKIMGDKAGRKLLAAGLVEPEGTPRAAMIQERLAKIVERNTKIAEHEAEKYKGPPKSPPQLPPPPIITPPPSPSGGAAPGAPSSSAAPAAPPPPPQINPAILSRVQSMTPTEMRNFINENTQAAQRLRSAGGRHGPGDATILPKFPPPPSPVEESVKTLRAAREAAQRPPAVVGGLPTVWKAPTEMPPPAPQAVTRLYPYRETFAPETALDTWRKAANRIGPVSDAILDIRNRITHANRKQFIKEGGFNPEEISVLRNVSEDATANPALRKMAQAALKVQDSLSKQQVAPLSGSASNPSGKVDIPKKTAMDLANEIIARNKRNARPEKTSRVPDDSEIAPQGVVNRDVKNWGKVLVDPKEYASFEAAIGAKKAKEWFTTDSSVKHQKLEDVQGALRKAGHIKSEGDTAAFDDTVAALRDNRKIVEPKIKPIDDDSMAYGTTLSKIRSIKKVTKENIEYLQSIVRNKDLPPDIHEAAKAQYREIQKRR